MAGVIGAAGASSLPGASPSADTDAATKVTATMYFKNIRSCDVLLPSLGKKRKMWRENATVVCVLVRESIEFWKARRARILDAFCGVCRAV